MPAESLVVSLALMLLMPPCPVQLQWDTMASLIMPFMNGGLVTLPSFLDIALFATTLPAQQSPLICPLVTCYEPGYAFSEAHISDYLLDSQFIGHLGLMRF